MKCFRCLLKPDSLLRSRVFADKPFQITGATYKNKGIVKSLVSLAPDHQTFKIITGREKVDKHEFFKISNNTHNLRGHQYKILSRGNG